MQTLAPRSGRSIPAGFEEHPCLGRIELRPDVWAEVCIGKRHNEIDVKSPAFRGTVYEGQDLRETLLRALGATKDYQDRPQDLPAPKPEPKPRSLDIQAFPESEDQHGGMGLRDFMAAEALTGLLANPARDPAFLAPDFASDAYQYADAMLARRVKG